MTRQNFGKYTLVQVSNKPVVEPAPFTVHNDWCIGQVRQLWERSLNTLLCLIK